MERGCWPVIIADTTLPFLGKIVNNHCNMKIFLDAQIITKYLYILVQSVTELGPLSSTITE